ncbi:hypothetical protein BD779DRAFT_224725 [Infundibulicybe gibba]|nr:hypothetical protein BD779DRAFT_224725 [Infundibulicybe gibba]
MIKHFYAWRFAKFNIRTLQERNSRPSHRTNGHIPTEQESAGSVPSPPKVI